MTGLKSAGLVCLIAAGLWILAAANIAIAQNSVFLSTNLESSAASYMIQFTPSVGGRVDRIQIQFPTGALAGNVGLGSLTVRGRDVRDPTATVDPGDLLLIDFRRTNFRAGWPVVVEILGVINPAAGPAHQVAVSLLESGALVEDIGSLPANIIAISGGGGGGDITAVNDF